MDMMRLTQRFLALWLLAGVALSAHGFTPLGQLKSWQITPLGYNFPSDIGGPQLGNEGYRWNVPTNHYAFDYSFLTYFGEPGIQAVDAALKLFTDLGSLSSITNDGFSLFLHGEPIPTDVKGPQNFSFAEAGLLDLKSYAMQLVIEELGLGQPTRYVWTLRGRNVETIGGITITNYSVIKLNYDPVTLQPSSYVNGQLYDYEVVEPLRIRGIDYADAIEVAVNPPFPYEFSAVADYALGPGEYFFGLSQDDVGGLNHLYNKNNFAVESLLSNITGSVIGSAPWAPYLGTNSAVSNVFGISNLVSNIIVVGLRPGVNKLSFKKVKYDSLLAQLFVPVSSRYTDTVITNSRAVKQSLQRVLTQPDLLFVAEDCGLIVGLVPNTALRTFTSAWQNNDALNGNDGSTGDTFGGPGVITPLIRISFSDQFPYWLNNSPDFLTGGDDLPASAVWGSFDENTQAPVIYPLWLNLTLEDLQRLGQ
jgi:hypothetical protein